MKTSIALALAVSTWSSSLLAAVAVPAIISDNMVLQRSSKTPLWGTADANEKVTVTFGAITADATAGADGKWRVDLNLQDAPKEAGELTIAGMNTIAIKNAIVGEVWLCSGQSNMEWALSNTNNAKEEIASANHPGIRHFAVGKKVANEPMSKLAGQWHVTTPETAGRFTAVGYYFGKEIHQKTGHAVGLINSSWGGTNAESWTSDAQLETVERYRASIATRKEALSNVDEKMAKFKVDIAAWDEQYLPKDADNAGLAKGWANAEFDASAWKSIDLPKNWQTAGLKHNGIVWFRKSIDVPADVAAGAATLTLGTIDDFDITYVNGKQVGTVTNGANNPTRMQRKYTLPAGTLTAGKNVIAVRVTDIGSNGGFGGPADAMRLTAGETAIPLDGAWTYEVEKEIDFAALPPRPVQPPINNPNQAAVLYNGMIAPILPYGIRGATWYQGESNAGRHAQYAELMGLLIDGWRKDFDRGEFPFYIVQLANFKTRAAEPSDTDWAKLRDAQLLVTKTVPNTGLAVTIDIGEAKDIHPRNKADVGKRLAALALAKDYGQSVEFSGPMYETHVVEGSKVRVTFAHADGLTASGGKPLGFAIAGADGKFVWADAAIEGNSIVLSATGVDQPTAVSYAWGDNPEVNLTNAAGLPAVPFKTK